MSEFKCDHVYYSGKVCNDEHLHAHYKRPHTDDLRESTECAITGCSETAVETACVTIRAIFRIKRLCGSHLYELGL